VNLRSFWNASIAAMTLSASTACDGKVNVGSLGPDGSSMTGGSGSSSSGSMTGTGDAASGSQEVTPDSAMTASADASDSAIATSLDGIWTGYIESYTFPSGSDAITMTLQLSGGVVTGTMVFGNMTAPPPATNPNVGYPPGLAFFAGENPPFVGEGFSYTIEMGTFDGSRLLVSVATNEIWKTWCELQQPVLWNAVDYACLPGWPSTENGTTCSQTNPTTQMSVPVDCGKLALCKAPTGNPCACLATGCVLGPFTSQASFDMQVSGSKADGSTTGAFSDHNVHFTRQ
jgi:hypothetical protein